MAMNIFRIFILLICVLRAHLKSQNEGYRHLKAVAVLFRHGDRAPVGTFPKDVYFKETYWPMGFGQLTNKGKKRLHVFGKWLRERYNGFLPETYSPEDTYVLSSDEERSISSAAVALAGLYPPKSLQIWNENLQWQPIPVHTRPKEMDPIIARKAFCPKYDSLLKAAKKSQYYQNINREHSGLYELVSSYTGWDVDDVRYFAMLHSTLQCYSSANESWLPLWIDDLDTTAVDYLAAQFYARFTFTKKMKRLGDGRFFDYLFSFFDKIIGNAADARKFLMLSGHLNNIVSFLSGMDIYEYLLPEYGATLIWELYENDSDYYLDLLYKRNQTHLETLELTVCARPCLYEHFKRHLSDVTVNETTWKNECNL